MTTAQAPISLNSADESAVRTVVLQFANTWNRHDMEGMHDLNTQDVEWINMTGNHWRGNAVVYKGQELPELKTRGSFILAKLNGNWKIAHFQNTVVDLEAEQNDPITTVRRFEPISVD